MSIRFIHTADWQIAKLFREIHGDKGAALRLQRLATIERIGEIANQIDADFVVVAGDVFEMNSVSDETIRRTILAMRHFSRDWILIPGNHDPALAESVWHRFERLLQQDNIRLALEATPIVLDHINTTILPAPLHRRHDLNDLTEWFDNAITPENHFRIGIAHGCIDNRLPEASEAKNPIADDRAQRANLDYLALGDWHGTLQIAKNTWYAGTPEIDRWRNNNAGNILDITIDSPKSKPEVNLIPTTHFYWRQHKAAISDREDLKALDRFIGTLENADRTLLQLEHVGSIDLSLSTELLEHQESWRAQLHELTIRDHDLTVYASDEDIDTLGTSGFLLDTINELRSISQQADHADSAYATTALAQLYGELTKVSQNEAV